MMNRGQLNLQWDAYSDHLQGMLQEIISNDSFSDVTLVTDEEASKSTQKYFELMQLSF